MRYLCVCTYGHSRSVALARVLHARGDEAVAIGHHTSPSAILTLSSWADKILTLETQFCEHVPAPFKSKIVDFHVGPDVWSNPYNQDLLKMLTDMVDERLVS